MKETNTEKRLDREAKKRGGRAYKWTGRKGVPDRILLLPIEDERHRAIVAKYLRFVETKSHTGEVDPIQDYVHGVLRKMGFTVEVAWTNGQIDEMIEEMRK